MFMSRVEKFRQIRKLRKKCFFTVLFSLVLMLLGITAVDYSLSGLMEKDKGVALVSFEPYNDDYYKIEVLGKCVYINTGYLRSDIERYKEYIKEYIMELISG